MTDEQRLCESYVDRADTIKCVALAEPGDSRCAAHRDHTRVKAKGADHWHAGDPVPDVWSDPTPHEAFPTPWKEL